MRILSLDEFVKLPVGTIFSEYKPAICLGLWRKMHTLPPPEPGETPNDFYQISIIAECPNGDHPVVDSAMSRWGMFDYDAQFAVYEPADLQAIRELLS